MPSPTKRPDSGYRPPWYYTLSPVGKADYDAWRAEGASSWMDEPESGAMLVRRPAKPDE